MQLPIRKQGAEKQLRKTCSVVLCDINSEKEESEKLSTKLAQ